MKQNPWTRKKMIETWKNRIEETLPRLLPAEAPEELIEAMRYSLMAGGKRFRPLLVLASCRTAGGDPDLAVEASCAVEYIHTYSLIHDDLPAMDNDELRRGLPTTHVQYGEDMAILSGDALHTEAFFIAARHPEDVDAPTRVEAVEILAKAAGGEGMAGGQVLDMRAETLEPTEENMVRIHRGKTARLIQASVLMGAVYAGASDAVRDTLEAYGLELGFLFQLADDILDITSTTEEMGKKTGKDSGQNKLTGPSVYGIKQAIALAGEKEARLKNLLQPFGKQADMLLHLARMVTSHLPE